MKSFFSIVILLFPLMIISQDLLQFPGYFNFSYNPKDGKISLQVKDLEKEFLYVQGLSTGVGSNDIGLDRGQIGRERIVKFKRAGSKLLLIQPNYSYRAISNNAAERKSVEEAFAQSVLWGFTIDKEENGTISIDLTPFLMQDAHDVAGSLESSKQGNYRIDASRSAINLQRTRNFPLNSEFDVLLTFTGKPTGAWIRSVAPSAEAITVHQHHSFVQLPDHDYKVRKFDPRSGFFGISYFDYATPISENINKQFTVRYRLEKKDPGALKSEAKEPIIYYLDSGCPEPIKSALMEGAAWWNEAFEAAGYINAFQVKVLPDTVDPLDVRYNVIQWIHRSTRGWSYGNTVTDPRTGEIIKGHVSLGSLRVRQDYLIAQAFTSPFKQDNKNIDPMMQMALARLRQLAAHEVGHTIGLNHNYISSTNARSSVMDYPHPIIEFTDSETDLSNAYDVGIGEWDKRAIIWGYQEFPIGNDENKSLDLILEQTNKMGLPYLSDQDARPLGSAHPANHLWDNGKDIVAELNRLMQTRRKALNQFGVNSIRFGDPMSYLENVLVPLYLSHRYQIEAVSKIIGGVDYAYSVKGDGQATNKIVPSLDQVNALNAILNSISPKELALSENLISLIPPHPPGFPRDRETFKNYTGATFDPIAAAESITGLAFSVLLHNERLARLLEQNARTGTVTGVKDYLTTIRQKIKGFEATSGLEKELKKNTERIFFVKLLGMMSNKSISSGVLAACKGYLKSVSTALTGNDDQSVYLQSLIEEFQKDPTKFEIPEVKAMPDGAPIGCFDE